MSFSSCSSGKSGWWKKRQRWNRRIRRGGRRGGRREKAYEEKWPGAEWSHSPQQQPPQEAVKLKSRDGETWEGLISLSRGAGGRDQWFPKTQNSGYLRKFGTVTFTQHTFMFFRGHRDPADDIHYIKWHGSSLCHQRKKMYHCLLFDVSPKRFQWDGEEKMEKSKVWRRQMRGRRRWCCFYFSFHVLTVCLRASWRLRKSHFKAFCFEIELLYSLFAFY